jgi:putative FmdB family regulatory protein
MAMPLYEYECRQCEHVFEELVFGDEPVACPKCQGRTLDKLLSVPARPQVEDGPGGLPMTCRSEGPPCGPHCRRA